MHSFHPANLVECKHSCIPASRHVYNTCVCVYVWFYVMILGYIRLKYIYGRQSSIESLTKLTSNLFIRSLRFIYLSRYKMFPSFWWPRMSYLVYIFFLPSFASSMDRTWASLDEDLGFRTWRRSGWRTRVGRRRSRRRPRGQRRKTTPRPRRTHSSWPRSRPGGSFSAGHHCPHQC